MYSNIDRDLKSIQQARYLAKRAKEAQKEYYEFGQKKMNQIIKHVAKVSEDEADRLAKLAFEETGFGN